jgi:hypothetical protein
MVGEFRRGSGSRRVRLAARNLAFMKTPRRPDPEPLETDDVRLVAGGTVLWAVALIALVVARLAGADVRGWWIAMCACGAGLGLLGVRYCQRRRDAIARDRAAGGGVAETTAR